MRDSMRSLMRLPLVYAAFSLVFLATSSAALSDTLVALPSKDTTIFGENSDYSNGSGVHLFVGMTAGAAQRRALMRFDLASIPPGSTVSAVSLRVVVNRAVGAANPTSLHRLMADWGEGASNAGFGRDGGGTQAEPGDATWTSRFYPGDPWTTPGGNFVATASASVSMNSLGAYTWSSTSALVADVQGWVDTPSTNFGWVVIGDESTPRTAKRLYSTQGGTAVADRPTLTVTYTPASSPPPPPPPPKQVPVPGWALGMLALALVAGMASRARRLY
jgi:hypothetical protein